MTTLTPNDMKVAREFLRNTYGMTSAQTFWINAIAQAIADERQKTIELLAGTFSKFCPDLMDELVKRYKDGESALDDFLECLRGKP